MTTRVAHVTSIERFAEAVAGIAEIVTDPTTLTESGHDFWGVGAAAELMLRPRNRDEIAAIVEIAKDHGIAVVPRGGASNCSGGMMPLSGRVLLDLSGLNRIIDIDE